MKQSVQTKDESSQAGTGIKPMYLIAHLLKHLKTA